MRASDVQEGLVFDIQHFAIHDGPGIRTTVFLQGCPLRCLWCHNPEGQPAAPQVFFSPEKCIACGWCVTACPQGLHHFSGEEHVFTRAGCDGCGDCALECYSRALEVSGRWMTVEQVVEVLRADGDFYLESGGGITLSGGEPLQQFAFARELLRASRQAGLHTCLETSGFTSQERCLEIARYVDLFLFDIKETDPALHRQYTGVDNRQILKNLFALDQYGASIVLRCPIIPGLNDRPDHLADLAGLANRLRHVLEIQLMSYHPLGSSKSQRLGQQYLLASTPRPSTEQVAAWLDELQSQTRVPVRKG